MKLELQMLCHGLGQLVGPDQPNMCTTVHKCIAMIFASPLCVALQNAVPFCIVVVGFALRCPNIFGTAVQSIKYIFAPKGPGQVGVAYPAALSACQCRQQVL